MADERIAAAAALFAQAWLDGTTIDAFPDDLAPGDLAEASAMQDAMAARIGEDIVGWKIGGEPRPRQRPRDRGLATSFAARHHRRSQNRRRREPTAPPEAEPHGALRCIAMGGERAVAARHRAEGRTHRHSRQRQCAAAAAAARRRHGGRRVRGSRPDHRQPRRGLNMVSPSRRMCGKHACTRETEREQLAW